MSQDIASDWRRLKVKRQMVRDARNVRERLMALMEYQGELMRFADEHRAVLEITVEMVAERKARAA